MGMEKRRPAASSSIWALPGPVGSNNYVKIATSNRIIRRGPLLIDGARDLGLLVNNKHAKTHRGLPGRGRTTAASPHERQVACG
jgi:hypothetical protein